MKVFTHPDNQQKAYLPLNPITEKLWYSEETDKNMRMIISARTEHPIPWTLTKVENTSPLGIQTLTFYQNFWNDHTDYIERDDSGNIMGMWANYFDTTTPIDPGDPTPTPSTVTAKITASTSTIKVGGSYKNLILNIYNDSDEDITTEYLTDVMQDNIVWTCSIDDEDWTNKVTWRVGASNNLMKIKFSSDSSTIGKILSIKCTITKDASPLESEILQLELVE